MLLVFFFFCKFDAVFFCLLPSNKKKGYIKAHSHAHTQCYSKGEGRGIVGGKYIMLQSLKTNTVKNDEDGQKKKTEKREETLYSIRMRCGGISPRAERVTSSCTHPVLAAPEDVFYAICFATLKFCFP